MDWNGEGLGLMIIAATLKPLHQHEDLDETSVQKKVSSFWFLYIGFRRDKTASCLRAESHADSNQFSFKDSWKAIAGSII